MHPTAKRLVTIAAVILGLLIAVYLMVRQKYPIINDIATVPSAPLSFFAPRENSGVDPDSLTYPPEFAAKQKLAYPHLAPLAVAAPPELVYQAALELAEDTFGWEVVAQDPENLRFQAVATTKLLSFKDDVVVGVSGIPAQSLVQMRSKSRLGKGDFGANAQRIDAFFKALALSAEELSPNMDSGSELMPLPDDGGQDEMPVDDLPEELPEESEGGLAPEMDAPGDEQMSEDEQALEPETDPSDKDR